MYHHKLDVAMMYHHTSRIIYWLWTIYGYCAGIQQYTNTHLISSTRTCFFLRFFADMEPAAMSSEFLASPLLLRPGTSNPASGKNITCCARSLWSHRLSQTWRSSRMAPGTLKTYTHPFQKQVARHNWSILSVLRAFENTWPLQLVDITLQMSIT